MKLTNTMREHVATSLKNKLLPAIDFEEKMKEIATREYHKIIPKEVLDIWGKDKEWFNTRAWVRMLKKGETNYNGSNVVGQFDIFESPSRGYREYIPYCEELAELSKKEESYAKKREALETKVRRVAYSCSTTKQLLEVLPEAAEFLPAEGTKAIVPIELYDSLRRDIDALSSRNS